MGRTKATLWDDCVARVNKLSEAVICALLRDFSNHPHPVATKNAQPIPAGTLMIRSPALADGAAQKVTRLLRE
jgi:hypothetical protein